MTGLPLIVPPLNYDCFTMSAESSAYDTAAKSLHSSVLKVKSAIRRVKRAAPGSEIETYWESVKSLDVRAHHLVKTRWPLEMLNGIAGFYDDFANALQWSSEDGDLTPDELTVLTGLCVSFPPSFLASKAPY